LIISSNSFVFSSSKTLLLASIFNLKRGSFEEGLTLNQKSLNFTVRPSSSSWTQFEYIFLSSLIFSSMFCVFKLVSLIEKYLSNSFLKSEAFLFDFEISSKIIVKAITQLSAFQFLRK
jgi:hypothetical protein